MDIAVIGYGMMGSSHVQSLRSLGYTVKVIIGRNGKKLKNFAKENGIKNWCTSLDEALEMGIDVLHICTPPVNHYDLIKKASENNIHVVCEKPFVLDDKQAEELVALAKEKGIVNALGFNVRFHEACINAKNLIKADKLGNICLLNGSYEQEFHALPSFYSWRYDPKQAGKMLATTEIGSHWIDLMSFLCGKKIEAVSASFGKFNPKRKLIDGKMYPQSTPEGKEIDIDTDDVAIVTFRLENGGLANVVLSEVTPGRYNYLDMRVTGDAGALWWNSEEINHLSITKKGEQRISQVLAFTGGFSASVTNMLREIYQDIEKGEPSKDVNYATFEDGLINTKVCNAIYASANDDSKWEKIN